MITLENLIFTANLIEQQQLGGLQAGGVRSWEDRFILMLYSIDDKSFKTALLTCVLVKEKPVESRTQLRYYPQVKDQIHTIKLQTRSQQQNKQIKLPFQLKPYHQSPSAINKYPPITHPLSRGFLDLSSLHSNLYTVAVLDQDQKFVKGYLSCNYSILDNYQNNSGPLDIYMFGIRIFLHGSQHKRAFLTVYQPKQAASNHAQILTIENQQQLAINHSKKLPIRRLEKGWLWYKDITEIQFTPTSPSSAIISLTLYSFDFSTCQATYICSYKGSLFVDFNSGADVKFVQLEMFDQMKGSEEVVATVQFRYCERTEKNLGKVKGMLSSSYLENAFSPAQFVYDNRSFVSNASLIKTRPTNPSMNSSLIHSPKHSPLLNLNKSSRNIFIKSKFHSAFTSNRGIPMDRQQRFPSAKKKLTDQLGYYAHRTLDINQLPTREKYRYSSFGKDTKECLKVNAHSRVGPGSGRYRLPSVFDKY